MIYMFKTIKIMNLYNILSINGIDIDKYLGGGGSEEINEIKQNTYNLSTRQDIITSDTLILYNSLTNGGFEYLEPFSVHSAESFIYNCNDILSNQSFTDTFKEVGPNINFNNVSITTNQRLNLKGQTFNSCLIQSDTEHLKLNYASMDSNSIYNNNFIDMKADTFINNDVKSNTFINISGFSNTGNTYSNNNILHITNNYIYSNTITLNKSVSINASAAENNSIRSNNLVYFNAHSQSGNLIYGNSLLNTINGFELNSNSYAGSCAKICHYSGSSNTFVASILDYTAYSISRHTLGALKDGHFKIGYANFVNFGANDNGGLLTIEVLTAYNIGINSIKGYCDVKAGDMGACTIQYNTINNISARLITSCKFSTNTICNFDVWSSYKSNTVNDCKYIKLNAHTDLLFANNNFSDIETLKINAYNSNMSNNKFSNISELHLKNGNLITNSTNSNTFGNISSYYFKYTDGLYDGTIFNSDYSDIYDKAFIKNVPCSWLNIGGGGSGGFDYWQSYSDHPVQGYNISDKLIDTSIDYALGVGPAMDFQNCTFGRAQHYFTGNEFVSNKYYNVLFEGSFKYLSLGYNDFTNCLTLNLDVNVFSRNTFDKIKMLNITCNRPNDSNTIKNCSDVNLYIQGSYTLNAESNKRLNICGGVYKSGGMIDNDFANINILTMSGINCKNKMNFISCVECVSNTFNNCQMLNLNACNIASNYYQNVNNVNMIANSITS